MKKISKRISSLRESVAVFGKSLRSKSRTSLRGFTLIEVVTVIFIISLLSTIFFVGAGKARALARDVERVKIAKDLQAGLTLYYLDHKKYPRLEQKCASDDDDGNGKTPSSDDYPSGSCSGDCTAYKDKVCSDGAVVGDANNCEGGANVVKGAGNGTKDTNESGADNYYGWTVGRSLDVFEYSTPVGGSCTYGFGGPPISEPAKFQTQPANGKCEIDDSFPPYSVVPQGKELEVTGVVAEQIGGSLMDTLYEGGYINRESWIDYQDAMTKDPTPYQCRYVVPAGENIRDMDGNIGNGREGYVQHYLIHCNLEVKEDVELRDGGFNKTIFEVISPGAPWICMNTQNGLNPQAAAQINPPATPPAGTVTYSLTDVKPESNKKFSSGRIELSFSVRQSKPSKTLNASEYKATYSLDGEDEVEMNNSGRKKRSGIFVNMLDPGNHAIKFYVYINGVQVGMEERIITIESKKNKGKGNGGGKNND